ncbi:MAG: transcriptional regulator [Gammaproteobacteria bacterium RIFCSPLOWO2_02_FULL_57_10]|nr:MAG: transcriptional regulator [Gammaproteobacteria bacterium RIFCSPLOWO2_02_FULL_57_10]
MLLLKDLIDHYSALCAQVPLRPIRNESDYGSAVAAVNALLDAGVSDEDHPLSDLLATLGELISDYEEKWRVPHATPAEVLRFLMSQHALGQSDLPEIGSQGVVSEILSGKRTLNVRQIKELAQRFAVSPSVFVKG